MNVRSYHKCNEMLSYLFNVKFKYSVFYFRDFIMRITRKINNLIPNMSGILDEHHKRQDTFYNNYRKVIDLLDKVIEKARFSGADIHKLREIHENLKAVVNDKNPGEVLRKVGRIYRVFTNITVRKLCQVIKEWVSIFWVHGEWIGARNKQIVWTSKRFSGDLFVSRYDLFPMSPEK